MSVWNELAMLFKERDNPNGYSPIFGTVTNLPELEILCGKNIVLDKDDVILAVDLYEQVEKEYINLGKEVVLLPYSSGQKFIVMGVIV